LKQIDMGKDNWQQSLPEGVAEEIIKNRYFGFRG
jgi:hypothetical protein